MTAALSRSGKKTAAVRPRHPAVRARSMKQAALARSGKKTAAVRPRHPAVRARSMKQAARVRSMKPAALASTAAARPRHPAADAPLTPEEQANYTAMRKVLYQRVKRKVPGAADDLARVDAVESRRGRHDEMRLVVGDTRRVIQRSRKGVLNFNPSIGHSVGKRTWMEEFRQVCVVKGLVTNSMACKRTLHVYGAIRMRGAEDKAPLPLLYKVEEDPPYTYFWMEYVGDDVNKAGVPMKEFQLLKARSLEVLREYGDSDEACEMKGLELLDKLLAVSRGAKPTQACTQAYKRLRRMRSSGAPVEKLLTVAQLLLDAQ